MLSDSVQMVQISRFFWLTREHKTQIISHLAAFFVSDYICIKSKGSQMTNISFLSVTTYV